MEGSAMLIQEAKQALIAPGDAESQQRLAQVSPMGFAWCQIITLSWYESWYSESISRTFHLEGPTSTGHTSSHFPLHMSSMEPTFMLVRAAYHNYWVLSLV